MEQIKSATILNYFKAAALGSLVLVSMFLCVLLFQISNTLVETQKDISSVIDHANSVLDQTNKTMLMTSKLINDSRLTLDNANKAIMDQRFYYENEVPGMVSQIHSILNHVDQAAGNLNNTVIASTLTVNSANARVQALAPIENNANNLIISLNSKVNDPKLDQTLTNLQATSLNAAEISNQTAQTMKNINAMSADAREDYTQTRHGWLYKFFKKVF